MSQLATTVDISAPATAVFDLIADSSRNPEWQTLLVEMGETAGRPGGVGCTFVGYDRVAGRKLPSTFIVTAADRPGLFQVNGTTTGGWARWTTILTPAGPGCCLQVSLEYELPGDVVGSLFGMLTGRRIEREFRQTYANLRRVAEAIAASAAVTPGPASARSRVSAPSRPGAQSPAVAPDLGSLTNS